jgi:hypothetical protein
MMAICQEDPMNLYVTNQIEGIGSWSLTIEKYVQSSAYLWKEGKGLDVNLGHDNHPTIE